jgi:hypothetical protein
MEDVPATPTYKAVGACKSGIFNYLPLLSGVQKLYHCRRASVANGLPFSSFGGPVKKENRKKSHYDITSRILVFYVSANSFFEFHYVIDVVEKSLRNKNKIPLSYGH